MKQIRRLVDAALAFLHLSFTALAGPWLLTAAKTCCPTSTTSTDSIEGETALRADRSVARRIKAYLLPAIKTLDTLPLNLTEINRLQHPPGPLPPRPSSRIMPTSSCWASSASAKHIVLLLSATPPASSASTCSSPERHRCRQHPQRRTHQRHPQRELRKYTSPMPILDEVGYLPIDQHGADLLFQVISARDERSIV